MSVDGGRLLNVDDYVPARYARTKILTQAGFEVFEAGTGADALRIIADQSPELVLLDINLPDMTGFEVCRRIREDPNTAAVAVLQMSASSVEGHHWVEGLESGADTFLIEPVDPGVLVATVKALLRVRRAEEELRRSNDDLKHFTFMLGHEMTEPLRNITTYTELLRRRAAASLTEDQNQFLDVIASSAVRMHAFVQDVMRYSWAGTAMQPSSHVPMDAVLDIAMANLHDSIAQSRAEITRDEMPVVEGDETGLMHLFQNLLSNAIKYRGAETPKVHVGVTAVGDEWTFTVKDNGIGIDPRYHKQVFTVFKRLHGREMPGTGIGLALCRRVVEKHGGRIWVDSRPGHGSTFSFTLPRTAVEPGTQHAV